MRSEWDSKLIGFERVKSQARPSFARAIVEEARPFAALAQEDFDVVHARGAARAAREFARGEPEPAFPFPVDAVEGAESRSGAAGLDFDQHEGTAVPAQEVDLGVHRG